MSGNLKKKDYFSLLPSVFFAFIFFGNLFFAPLPANSQTNAAAPTPTGSGYQVLAPFPGVTGQSPGLTVYLRAVFSVMLGLAVVLAVLMIVIGGIQYMGSESIFSHEEAKGRITAAILGLLLAFLSWVILQTINPKLLYVGLNVPEIKLQGAQGNLPPPCAPGQWYYTRTNNETNETTNSSCYNQDQQAGCERDRGENQPPNTTVSPSCLQVPAGPTTPPPAAGCPATAAEYTAGHDAVRADLQSGGVEVKTNTCTVCPGSLECTSVFGLPSTAVAVLKRMKQDCDATVSSTGVCSIIVTGGTEAGHQTHGINKAVFDIGDTENVCKYISGGKSCDQIANNQTFPTASGATCTYEKATANGAHFHCR